MYYAVNLLEPPAPKPKAKPRPKNEIEPNPNDKPNPKPKPKHNPTHTSGGSQVSSKSTEAVSLRSIWFRARE